MPQAKIITCKECAEMFHSTKGTAEFCARHCQQSFNNRRHQRGAQMYDLVMAMRFERHRAKPLRLWTMICRLATNFKREDDIENRRSWNDPEKIINNTPALHTEHLAQWRKK